jgi:hypothetical protein
VAASRGPTAAVVPVSALPPADAGLYIPKNSSAAVSMDRHAVRPSRNGDDRPNWYRRDITTHDRRQLLMNYFILVYENPEHYKSGDVEQKQAEVWGAFMAYTAALREAGVLRGGAPLADVGSATSVRRREGETQVQDGPFAETKEILAGFYEIECATLDEAIAWASRCPCTEFGTAEVRPHGMHGEE